VTGSRLAAVLAAGFVLAAAGLLAGAGPAAASALPIGQCTTSSGVILAVDFSHWGGPLLRACGSTPTTGYTLLNQGGWHTAGTQHDGPAFICRIGFSGYSGGTRYPTPAQDACVLTPPASAYWSYWHADPGQNSWSYSQLGAMSYHPKPGSVDLWTFGATNTQGTQGRPTVAPDAVRAHNSTPTGTTPRPPARTTTAAAPRPGAPPPPGPPGAGQPGTRPPAPAGTTTPAGRATASPARSAATSTPAGSGTPGPGTAANQAAPGGTGPPIVDVAPDAAPAADPSGSATPALVAGGLILALGAGAGYATWRRRRAS
jgi:hypothetical protein